MDETGEHTAKKTEHSTGSTGDRHEMLKVFEDIETHV